MKVYAKLRIKILKHLYNNPLDSYSYKIAQRLDISSDMIYLEVKNMLREGLIVYWKEFYDSIKKHKKTYSRRKYYKLTCPGKKLAKLYLEIDQVYLNLSPLNNYKKHL